MAETTGGVTDPAEGGEHYAELPTPRVITAPPPGGTVENKRGGEVTIPIEYNLSKRPKLPQPGAVTKTIEEEAEENYMSA
mmetsp:Transcript_21686/g.34235  ORF Transcript_21686/g.34235 Transcript_21686/m.34235 type:complete len:80 (-) Transcript_21686:134-373(-)